MPLLPDNNTYIFDNLVDILELTSEDFSDILHIYSYYKKHIPQNNISEITNVLNPNLTILKYNDIQDKLKNISKIIMLFFLLIFSKKDGYQLKIRLVTNGTMYYEINKNNSEICHLSIHYPKSTVGDINEINNEIHLLLNNNQRINFFYDTNKKIVGKAYFTSENKLKDIVYEGSLVIGNNINLQKYKDYINFFEIILTIVYNNYEITRGAEPIADPLAASTAKAVNSAITNTNLEIINIHTENKRMIIKNINKKTNINLYSLISNYSYLLNKYNKSFISINNIREWLSECLEKFKNNIENNKFVLISYTDLFENKFQNYLQNDLQNDFKNDFKLVKDSIKELKRSREEIDLEKISYIKKKYLNKKQNMMK